MIHCVASSSNLTLNATRAKAARNEDRIIVVQTLCPLSLERFSINPFVVQVNFLIPRGGLQRFDDREIRVFVVQVLGYNANLNGVLALGGRSQHDVVPLLHVGRFGSNAKTLQHKIIHAIFLER